MPICAIYPEVRQVQATAEVVQGSITPMGATARKAVHMSGSWFLQADNCCGFQSSACTNKADELAGAAGPMTMMTSCRLCLFCTVKAADLTISQASSRSDDDDDLFQSAVSWTALSTLISAHC